MLVRYMRGGISGPGRGRNQSRTAIHSIPPPNVANTHASQKPVTAAQDAAAVSNANTTSNTLSASPLELEIGSSTSS